MIAREGSAIIVPCGEYYAYVGRINIDVRVTRDVVVTLCEPLEIVILYK